MVQIWDRAACSALPFYSKTGQTSTVVSVKRIRFSLSLSWRNKPLFHFNCPFSKVVQVALRSRPRKKQRSK
jgi:hypothetical protein